MSNITESLRSVIADGGHSVEHRPLLDPSVSAEPHLPARHRFKSLLSDHRFYMGAILIIATLLMGGHRGFFTHLDGRQVQKMTFQIDEGKIASSMRSIFRSQAVVNVLGNLIANSARVLLTAAIGITFVQVLICADANIQSAK